MDCLIHYQLYQRTFSQCEMHVIRIARTSYAETDVCALLPLIGARAHGYFKALVLEHAK